MAGFEVSIYGRFWVSTEVWGARWLDYEAGAPRSVTAAA